MKRPHVLAILAGIFSGLAVYAWADPLPADDQGGTLPDTSVPICINCSLSGQLIREKTAPAQECVDEWGELATRRFYVGRCARYQCAYGYYYIFEGWYPLPTYQCTNEVVNDPDTCPAGTCIYIPWLSDPLPLIAGRQSSCSAGHQVPSGPLTTAYTSLLVKAALAPHESK